MGPTSTRQCTLIQCHDNLVSMSWYLGVDILKGGAGIEGSRLSKSPHHDTLVHMGHIQKHPYT